MDKIKIINLKRFYVARESGGTLIIMTTTNKEYNALKKTVSKSISEELKSFSFWSNRLNTLIRSDKSATKLFLSRFDLSKLPSKDEITRIIKDSCFANFNLYDEDGNVLIVKTKYKEQVDKNLSKEIDNISFVKKETFTQSQVFNALFTPCSKQVRGIDVTMNFNDKESFNQYINSLLPKEHQQAVKKIKQAVKSKEDKPAGAVTLTAKQKQGLNNTAQVLSAQAI